MWYCLLVLLSGMLSNSYVGIEKARKKRTRHHKMKSKRINNIFAIQNLKSHWTDGGKSLSDTDSLSYLMLLQGTLGHKWGSCVSKATRERQEGTETHFFIFKREDLREFNQPFWWMQLRMCQSLFYWVKDIYNLRFEKCFQAQVV